MLCIFTLSALQKFFDSHETYYQPYEIVGYYTA